MTKSMMTALVSYLTTQNDPSMTEVLDALTAELNRGAEAKAAKTALYEAAKPVVFEAMRIAASPISITELWNECSKALPEGMTKGMVQYGITRLWADEVVKHEGKTATYSRA